MTRNELTKKIAAAESCPYDTADLLDRVARRRLLSRGQSRWLAQLIGDGAVAVKTDNPSQEYVIVMYATGQSLEALAQDPRVEINRNATFFGGIPGVHVTYPGD